MVSTICQSRALSVKELGKMANYTEKAIKP